MADQEHGGVEAPEADEHLAGADGAQAQQATAALLERERAGLDAIRNKHPLLICGITVNSNSNRVFVDPPKTWGRLLQLLRSGAVFPAVESDSQFLPVTTNLSVEQVASYGKNMRYLREQVITMGTSQEYQAAARDLNVDLPATTEQLKKLLLMAFPRCATVKKLQLGHSIDGAQYWPPFYEELGNSKAQLVHMLVPPAPGDDATSHAVVTFKIVHVWWTNDPGKGQRLPNLQVGQVALPAQAGPANQQDDAERADEGEDGDELSDDENMRLAPTSITEYITSCVVNDKIGDLYQALHAGQVTHLVSQIQGNSATMMTQRMTQRNKRRKLKQLKPVVHGPLFEPQSKVVRALVSWRKEREACEDPPPLSVGGLGQWRDTNLEFPDPSPMQQLFSAALKQLVDLLKISGSPNDARLFGPAIRGAYATEVHGTLALALPERRPPGPVAPVTPVTSPGEAAFNQLVQMALLQQQQQQQQQVFQQAQQQQQQRVFQQELPPPPQPPPPDTPPSPTRGRRPLATADSILQWLGEDDIIPQTFMQEFATMLVTVGVMSVAHLQLMWNSEQERADLMSELAKENPRLNKIKLNAFEALLQRKMRRP